MTAIGLGLSRATIKEAGKYGRVYTYPLQDYALTGFTQTALAWSYSI